MVVVDAVSRLLPGALGDEESGRIESFSAELDGGLEYPQYTRPAEFRGWHVPEVLLSGDHAPDRRVAPGGEPGAERGLTEQRPPSDFEPIRWEDEDALFGEPAGDGHSEDDAWLHEFRSPESDEERIERERRERARNSRNPVVRATAGLPRGVRITIDWAVTIIGAIAIVLAIKAWVVNPYRIPSSSMEPTLHCARPGSGCESRFSDRVLANRFIYHLRDPARGDIIVFKTPKAAEAKCGAGGTFVKRLVGLPGETWEERDGVVYINGKRLVEPYVRGDRRDSNTYAHARFPKGGTSSWGTTACSRATRASGAPCRGRTSSAKSSSSTGRRCGSASARRSSSSASC